MNLSEALQISPGVTAIIGGGGKTTLMERLAHELSGKARVIVCTTTHIYPEKTMPCLVSPAQAEIAAARADGDSVGGVIECVIEGLPAGIGDPMFGGLENRIARTVFAIPAVKGVEFGAGFAAAKLRGSQNNDDYVMTDGKIRTATNNSGGILGGITSGMPLIFRAALKPTPSISRPQQSVSLSKGEMQELIVKGRHDPCIVPRAVPVIEAAAAIAIFDMILGNTRTDRRKP